MVICLERGADLHMAQLMPLPLTISCFSKIQTGFTFLVPADPGSRSKAVKRVCVAVVCRPPEGMDQEAQRKKDPRARPRPLYDIPYMFEAREFLRKKLIGKKVEHLRYFSPYLHTWPLNNAIYAS